MKLDMAWLSTADNSFEVDMRKLQSRGLEFDPKVDAQVQDIIARVRQYGDDEVLALTRKHDNHPAAGHFRIGIGSRTTQSSSFGDWV